MFKDEQYFLIAAIVGKEIVIILFRQTLLKFPPKFLGQNSIKTKVYMVKKIPNFGFKIQAVTHELIFKVFQMLHFKNDVQQNLLFRTAQVVAPKVHL